MVGWGEGARQREGRRKNNASPSQFRQLKFHHRGTNVRKDFNRTNNLGLRNLDTEPLKSRSLENSDRKSSVHGMTFFFFFFGTGLEN